ncbi:Cof-type HAD-IIB family hydrolase [Paenibacillus sp. MBLB4367]|uniref:Cof-type HAD-IIB family hydrolase n=1 Tax=Paenibacillus sp. MBLB4367 TaxID=3384767 RepID=UPI0039083C4C
MVKLIVLDIDDTLLDDKGSISQETKDVIKKTMDDYKVNVTLATGRMFVSARHIAEQIGVTAPVITYQGALIKTLSDSRTLYEQAIDSSAVKAVMQYAEQKSYHLHVYSGDVLYVKEANEKVRKYSDMHGVPYVVQPDFHALLEAPMTKMLIFEESDVVHQAWLELSEQLQGQCYVTKSKPYFLEIMHHEVNKGTALRMLCGYLGYELSDVMAIGDGWNDKDMLKAAGLAVAMGNAADEVKLLADDVTDTNNAEGVSKAIRKHIWQANVT